jgi:hypothetical protein
VAKSARAIAEILNKVRIDIPVLWLDWLKQNRQHLLAVLLT